MKASQLTASLQGLDLGDIPTEMASTARDAGLVVVLGTSRDAVSFYGAIEGEADVPDGGTIHFDRDGLLPDADSVPEEGKADYYDRKRFAFLIDAEWEQHGFPWTFTTVIPHHRFVAVREGARYCRGIVFDIKAIAGGAA
jgi:hypothetical protein